MINFVEPPNQTGPFVILNSNGYLLILRKMPKFDFDDKAKYLDWLFETDDFLGYLKILEVKDPIEVSHAMSLEPLMFVTNVTEALKRQSSFNDLVSFQENVLKDLDQEVRAIKKYNEPNKHLKPKGWTAAGNLNDKVKLFRFPEFTEMPSFSLLKGLRWGDLGDFDDIKTSDGEDFVTLTHNTLISLQAHPYKFAWKTDLNCEYFTFLANLEKAIQDEDLLRSIGNVYRSNLDKQNFKDIDELIGSL